MKKIKHLDKFYYEPHDLIPNLEIIKENCDDEFNEHFYLYYYVNNNKKFMRELTDAQQNFINKRFKLLEILQNRKIDKFKITNNIAIITKELTLRNIDFKSISIDTKKREIIVWDFVDRYKCDLAEKHLVIDIKSCIKRDCSDYLRKYNIIVKSDRQSTPFVVIL